MLVHHRALERDNNNLYKCQMAVSCKHGLEHGCPIAGPWNMAVPDIYPSCEQLAILPLLHAPTIYVPPRAPTKTSTIYSVTVLQKSDLVEITDEHR